jgi:alkylhydroperoxidase family enzyme
MTTDASDGGTDSWTSGGAAALATYAPEVATSFARLVSVRPSGVNDEMLEGPEVAAFADQFRVDVSVIDEQLRAAFATATGERSFAIAQMVWISDVAPRVHAALDALFGPSKEWPGKRRQPVADTWGVIDAFLRSVARLDALDVTTTELVRLRGARQHHCRICTSRRSAAAIEAGADAVMFDAVDHYESSDLPDATKAALALTDAMIWTPTAIPEPVVAAVRELLTPAQAVEVVLDVARNAANKIAVALGADAATVTDGVELFVTDEDGGLTVV